ncbi:hypothetical protein Aduo_005007 [Ancylostoma duodenale]
MKLAVIAVILFIGGKLSMSGIWIGATFLFLAQSFKIPIGFGGISIDRTQNNELALGLQRGVNVLGNGYERNSGLTIGNGTFSTNDATDVLVAGTRSGPRSSLGLTKDGFNIGGNVAVQTKPKVIFGFYTNTEKLQGVERYKQDRGTKDLIRGVYSPVLRAESAE